MFEVNNKHYIAKEFNMKLSKEETKRGYKMSTTRENIATRNSKMLLVDSDKFKRLIDIVLKERKITASQLSTEYGYSSNYIRNIIQNGVISRQMIKFLDADFNIKYDDYKPIETVNDVKSKHEPKMETNNDELVSLLKSCVKDLDVIAKAIMDLNDRVDDLKAQSELDSETLESIKNNVKFYKPTALATKN